MKNNDVLRSRLIKIILHSTQEVIVNSDWGELEPEVQGILDRLEVNQIGWV